MDTDTTENIPKNEEEKKEEIVEETSKEGETKEEEKKNDDNSHTVVLNEDKDIPKDKVNLRLLRPNSNRTDILLNASDTIASVKQKILETWPKEWTDEVPTTIENIKLLHFGKYLEDDSTLEANKIPEGQTTIVHLIIKFTKKELAEKEKEEEKSSGSTACCCIIS